MNKLLASVVLLTFLATPASASPPPEHRVTICHATPPDTAANGWVEITVDVASVGYRHSGHEDEHDADIIPPYEYDDFSYPGKGDQAILANGCVSTTPSPSQTPSPSPSGSPSPSQSPSPSVTPSPSGTPSESPSETPRGNPSPSVCCATSGTLPPSQPPLPVTGVSSTAVGLGLAALFLILVGAYALRKAGSE